MIKENYQRWNKTNCNEKVKEKQICLGERERESEREDRGEVKRELQTSNTILPPNFKKDHTRLKGKFTVTNSHRSHMFPCVLDDTSW